MEKVATLNSTVEIYHCSGEFSLVAGEELSIKVNEEDELEETCPAGHTWKVKIRVSIVENEV